MSAKILLFLTIILAIFLHLFNLDTLPSALNWDEISLGYNAYSVVSSGKDEWGQFLPLSFRAYGDYKLPGYIYLDIPFIKLFGLNEWGVRLPSAILGIGLVFLVFLILKEKGNIHVASWGAFLAAVIPWTIILSRIALEAQLALFLTTLAFYLFILGLRKNYFLFFSAICFGLTIFSYNSSRIVTPLLILSLGLFYWKQILSSKKISIASLLIFAIFFIMALPKALLQDSSARYRWTQIVDEGAIAKINEFRGSSALPPTLSEIRFNKVTYFIPEVMKNYISHFSPNFLFLNGGSNYQFSVPGSGLLYPVLAPFLLLGFWQIYKERKKWQLFSFAWLLIAPIPAAITRDSPHALRSILMITPMIMIISLGLAYCLNGLNPWIDKRKMLIKFIIILVLLFSLFLFWKNYSIDYTRNYSWAWQYGYKQAVNYIQRNGNQYEKIYFTKKYGEPHEFLLFYMQFDSEQYRNDPSLNRYRRSDWYWVDGFDRYRFLNDWEVKENAKCPPAGRAGLMSNVKCLLITSPGNYPEDSKLLEVISFLDGEPAFDIVELPQVQ